MDHAARHLFVAQTNLDVMHYISGHWTGMCDLSWASDWSSWLQRSVKMRIESDEESGTER